MKDICKVNHRVVYTTHFGNYDELVEPRFHCDDVDYVCFTDDPTLTSKFWDVRIVNDSSRLSAHYLNRYYKLHPHELLPTYTESLYIDSSIILLSSVVPLFEKYLKNNTLSVPLHPNRICAYDEAFINIELNRDSANTIINQIDKYRLEGFPYSYGLYELGTILRSHNQPDVKALMELWWTQLKNHSKRDQISFTYCCWKNNFKFIPISDSFRNLNDYFFLLPHRPEKPIKYINYKLKYILKYVIYCYLFKFIKRIKLL